MEKSWFGTGRRGTSAGKRWMWRLLVGGSLLAFLLILIFIGQRERNWREVTVAQGEHRTVSLSSTRSVRLQDGAKFGYVDPEARWTFRDVARLQTGAASFVMEDSGRGFVLETPSARAIALHDHTRFEVEVEGDTTVVTVRLGAVSVAPKEHQRAAQRIEEGKAAQATKAQLMMIDGLTEN